jgi:DNA-binding CsgD family transcriptional regulator
MHHVMLAILRDGVQFMGHLPLWRDQTMRFFDSRDAQFLEAAAPHIAHGLMNASYFRDSLLSAYVGFEKATSNRPGVVLIDRRGRVLALDQSAKAMLFDIGAFNAVPPDGALAFQVNSAFEYIGRTLGQILGGDMHDPFRLNKPGIQIFSHRSGVALKLHGVIASDAADVNQFVVLLEKGELSEHRRRRIIYRYGLSERELQVLHTLGENLRPAEIAAMFGLRRDALKSQLKRLLEKLELADYSALRAFVRTKLGTMRVLDDR